MSSGYCDPYVRHRRAPLEWITLIEDCPHDEADSILRELHGDGRTARVCGAVVAIALLPGGGDRVRLCLRKVHEIFQHRCPCGGVQKRRSIGPGFVMVLCGACLHEYAEIKEVRP